MDKKRTLINKLKRFKSKLNKEMAIRKVILFGSRATGRAHKWSDIDLIIVSKNFSGSKFRERATKMYDYWDLDYPVDFLCYTPNEFKKMSKMVTIVKEAVEKGIVI